MLFFRQKKKYIYTNKNFISFLRILFFSPIMCVFVPLRFRSSLFSLSFFIKFGMNLYKEPKKGKKRKKSRSRVTTHACVCSAFKIQEKKKSASFSFTFLHDVPAAIAQPRLHRLAACVSRVHLVC